MKILLVQPAVSPSKGGAQWNTARLASGLAHRGHVVRLIGEFQSVPEMRDFLDHPAISIAPIRVHSGGLLPIIKLLNETRKFKPDVIHSCLRSGDVATGLAALILKKPVITTVGEKLPTEHDVRHGVGWKGKIHKFFLRRVFSAACATSQFSKEHLTNYSGMSESKIQVVPNGVDTEIFNNHRESPSDPTTDEAKKVELGVVGRIAPEKRVDLLIELVEELHRRGIDAHATVVGEGISEEFVKKQVEASTANNNIQFLGNQPDMVSVYRKFDVLIHFGTVEGFGLALAEAMACGIPVVAANAGGSAEIIENTVDGFLVEPGAISDYADAVVTLAADNTVSQSISANAQQKISTEYSITKFVENYESVYTSIAGESHA